MQAPDLAIKELRRCIKDLGLQGVEIGTHVENPAEDSQWNLSDPYLFPIFEEAERLGACIFVHPWGLCVLSLFFITYVLPDMMAKPRMEKYWLPW